MPITRYRIHTIPDCTEHRFVARHGGGARQQAFLACEHLLRMLTNFRDSQISLAIRFLFDPGAAARQQRLRLQLAIRTTPEESPETVKQLIDTGPLAEFYSLQPEQGTLDLAPLDHEYGAVCEVIRRERKTQPFVDKSANTRVPAFYYSAFPLEAREDNDYQLVDAILSNTKQPCLLELTATPVDHDGDEKAHFRYLTRLMSVNQYGDDLPVNDQLRTAPTSPATLVAPLPTRIKDPMADEVLQEGQDLRRSMREPQLLFGIKAYGTSRENAFMLASAVAETGFAGGKYQLLRYAESDGDSPKEWVRKSREDSGKLAVSLHAHNPAVWSSEASSGYLKMARLCRIGSVNELKGIFRLPVGGVGSPHCIRKSTDPEPPRETSTGKTPVTILVGDDLESGETPPTRKANSWPPLDDLFSGKLATMPESRVELELLAKHVFIAGVPGSGKTVAVFNLLAQLAWHQIPFLVIEPAKTEYRALKTLTEHHDPRMKELGRRLRVYTPGNEAVSPFRFNPLAFPAGVGENEHMENVLSTFEAAMPMDGPLQALIAESVEEVYQMKRPEDPFPQMVDLVAAAGRIMQRKKYEGEVRSNLQAAIEVRLGLLTRRSMGQIFHCTQSDPAIADLLREPTIIEMDALPQNQACLLTLFLLTAVREQIRVSNRDRGRLHHVMVIEEAHNIVGRTGEAKPSEGAADPKAFAAAYVSRMLAELRALGEGIIIADQLPSTVAPEVVKNTSTKLAHRLVSNEDREDLGGSMLLGPTETEEMARLKVGEAYLYAEGFHRPRRVKALNSFAYLKIGDFLASSDLVARIQTEDWFLQGAQTRYREAGELIKGVLDDARSLLHRYQDKVSAWRNEAAMEESSNERADVAQTGVELREEIVVAVREFDRRLASVRGLKADDENKLAAAAFYLQSRYDDARREFLGLADQI